MTKFLIGLATGIILTILTAVVVVFALARLGSDRKPSIGDNSTLVLRLEGEFPERAPVELPIPFFEQKARPTMKDVWDVLRKASVDSRIKAVLIEPRGLAVGWGKLQEIRSGIEKVKKSGKPVIAHLEMPGTREYYLATAADQIYMAPQEFLNLKGLRAELVFFRRTMDKLGVQVEIEHAGKYKDFGDTFVRDKMSPETQEVYNSVLDDLYAHLTSTIAAARKKTPEQVKAIIDEGPFLAKQAKEKGLIDDLLYDDQVLDLVKKRGKISEVKPVSLKTYAKIPASSLGIEGGSKIALVVGQGGIVSGEVDEDDFTGDNDGIGSITFNKLLKQVSDDASVKGVIVRVDSPGGDAIASDAIWRAMSQLSRKKPTVISMSDVAASGGYYIAMTGDEVVAYPGTVTGSIGVVYGKANLRGLYDKIGITKDFLLRGRFANVDSDYFPLSDDGRKKLREGIDETYRTFVSRAANGRKRTFDQLEPLAQGRVWLGSQAKANGLVDELGGIDRAMEIIRAKAKLGAADKLTLVTYPPKRNVFEILLKETPDSIVESQLAAKARAWMRSHGLAEWQLRLWSQGGLLALMPYSLSIQ